MKPIAEMLDDLAEPVQTNQGVIAYVPLLVLEKAIEEREAEFERDREALDRCRQMLKRLAMSPVQIERWRDEMLANLEAWTEPDGLLVQTEPDPSERALARYNLTIALDALARILPPLQPAAAPTLTP